MQCGQKYKVNKEKLLLYTNTYKLLHFPKNDIVTIKSSDSDSVRVYEHRWVYPIDCIETMRNEKLNRIL